MKLAFLGDTHFGARGDSISFQNYFERFYNEVFFPYLIENEITHVIQLGDLFDRRKYINFHSLNRAKEFFFHKFKEHGIQLIVFPGNHDIYYKNTLKINALRELVEGIPNITIYYEPTTLDFDGMHIDLIPWITPEDESNVMKFIEESASDICLGHFEISGFDMMKGVTSHDGMGRAELSHYDCVYSGHFHHESKQGNIHYIGTPYEITWSDYNDPKGFFIFDTETKKASKIINPNSMFHRIKYNDEEEYNYSLYDGTIIKVIVSQKDDNKFENFIDSLYSVNPVDISIIESTVISEDDIDTENIDTEDTLTTIIRNIDNIQDTNIDKDKLKIMCQEIYNEATELGREQ